MRPFRHLALFLIGIPSLLAGQAPGTIQSGQRWAMSLSLGSSAGGPTRGLEAAMVSGGYTEPFGGCSPFVGCIPETPSPTSYSHANPWLLGVRYRVRGNYAAELLIGQPSSGSTSGNRAGEHLDIDYGGTLIAPVGSLGLEHVRIGLGPALLRGDWDYRNAMTGASERVKTHTLGWVGSATLRLPVGPILDVQVTGQYRGFGTTEVRPHRGSSSGFPAARVNASHSYVAGGLGIAF